MDIITIVYAIALFLIGIKIGRLVYAYFKKSKTVIAPREKIFPAQVQHEDPLVRDIVAKAWNTGKSYSAIRHLDGTFSVEEFSSHKEPDA